MSETNKRNDGGRIPVRSEELININRIVSNIKTSPNHKWRCLAFMIRKSYCVAREAAPVPTRRKLVRLWWVTSLLKLKNNRLEQVLHNVRPYRSYRAIVFTRAGEIQKNKPESGLLKVDSLTRSTHRSARQAQSCPVLSSVHKPDPGFPSSRIQTALPVAESWVRTQ